MKIRHRLMLLLPTVPYGNLAIEVSGEIDTSSESDMAEIKDISKRMGIIGKPNEILRDFIQQELLDNKEAIEQESAKLFKLQNI